MPLLTEELDFLSSVAGTCDGEPWEMHERFLLPGLIQLPEGHLWALAGMLLDHMVFSAARIVAAYARAVINVPIEQRPDPVQFARDFLAEKEDLIPLPD